MMLSAMIDILLSLSPWLLLGMTIAGVLHVVLPHDFIRRHLAGRGGVIKAVALGVPLPLCSCGVIPAGLGLKKDGASDGAAVGFLISTPQTGVDSILVGASFLGWPFAFFKVGAAALTGLVGGWLTDRGGPSATDDSEPFPSVDAPRRTWRDLISHALEILQSIWKWLVFGIVASAAITAFVPQDFFVGLSTAGPVLPILAALAISLPLYVCATASVPIAAALVASGMPAGAALVFLMAGPATNVATIGAVYRGLGRRALIVYLATIVGGSVGAGILFDSLLTTTASEAIHHHENTVWWAVASAIVLTALILRFAVDDLRRWVLRRSSGVQPEGDAMQVEIAVEGMRCSNCVAHVEKSLRQVEGVTAVEVELEPGVARVSGETDLERLREAIREAGYVPN